MLVWNFPGLYGDLQTGFEPIKFLDTRSVRVGHVITANIVVDLDEYLLNSIKPYISPDTDSEICRICRICSPQGRNSLTFETGVLIGLFGV